METGIKMVMDMVSNFMFFPFRFIHLQTISQNHLNDILIFYFRLLVGQLRSRENQPDRMTMIAIADGNQVSR